MKEFKGAIFDLDGTIIDSMDVWETIDIKFLEKRNITMPNDYIEKINYNTETDVNSVFNSPEIQEVMNSVEFVQQ